LKYFFDLQTLELGGHCPVATPWLRAWWQPHSDCRLQTSAGIRQVHVYTDSVVQINQHNFQQS